MKNMRKKSIAVAAGLAITGIVSASAASLNGLGTESLGSDTAIVGSCDTDGVDVTYETSIVPGPPAFVGVDNVVVANVNALCDTLDYEIELFDIAGVSVGSGSGVVGLTANSFTAAMSANTDAEDVANIAIVISG